MIDQLLHPKFDDGELKAAKKLTKGLPASPGAATGKIYFNAADAVAAVENGNPAVLVRLETSPEDLAGMVAANAAYPAARKSRWMKKRRCWSSEMRPLEKGITFPWTERQATS